MAAHSYQYQSFIPGQTAQRIFDAWIEPRELLCWFSEYCVVEPWLGGRYECWGRYTYGGAEPPTRARRIAAFEPGRTLQFEWPFEAAPGVVTLSFEAAERGGTAGTRVHLRHDFESFATGAGAAERLEDWWRMAFGHLHGHVAGEALNRVDFADPAPRVRLSVFIAAAPKRVFAALTTPALMDRWIATAARVDLREGGDYGYGWTYDVGGRPVAGGPTRILELVPNERLVTDWPDWRGAERGAPTRVVWTLLPEREGTRLTLIHEGFAAPLDLGDYPYGWRPYLQALSACA